MRAYHASRPTPKTSVALCRALSLPLLLCLSIIARNAYLNQRPLGSQVAGMQRGLRGIWSFEIHINRTRPVVPDRRDRPRAQYQRAFSNPARAPITPPPPLPVWSYLFCYPRQSSNRRTPGWCHWGGLFLLHVRSHTASNKPGNRRWAGGASHMPHEQVGGPYSAI